MRVLVTGGAGFIGGHLVQELLTRGHEVRVLDNLSTGFRDNLRPLEAAIEFHEGDLRDRTACLEACRAVDLVFHLAALGSVPRSIHDPQATNEVNVTGTLNLLVAARDAGARRVIFSSSSSVYGDASVSLKCENLCPNPRSPYAVSKLVGEHYCRVFRDCYGLETVVLRYFNVFGPRQSPSSQYAAVIPRFISALREGRRPIIYGDGLQSRDFTFVANVVAANLLAAEAPSAVGETFNIACGGSIALCQVLSQLQELLGTHLLPIHEAARAGDIRDSRADVSKAMSRIGYRPLVSFSEGLARTVDAFLSQC